MRSFVDRIKDTLKVSGAQVSPTEIEEVLRMHPGKLITDVSVAGVSGGRTSDEKVPRAWVVLSDEGRKNSVEATLKELDQWARKNLSSYKWLRGGFEVVDQVSFGRPGCLVCVASSSRRRTVRSQSHLQGRCSGESCKIVMKESFQVSRKPRRSCDVILQVVRSLSTPACLALSDPPIVLILTLRSFLVYIYHDGSQYFSPSITFSADI